MSRRAPRQRITGVGIDNGLTWAHLAVVDGHDGADELGRDHEVAEVRLDDGGLLEGPRLLLGLLQLLHQRLVLALERPGEPPAHAGRELCGFGGFGFGRRMVYVGGRDRSRATQSSPAHIHIRTRPRRRTRGRSSSGLRSSSLSRSMPRKVNFLKERFLRDSAMRATSSCGVQLVDGFGGWIESST